MSVSVQRWFTRGAIASVLFLGLGAFAQQVNPDLFAGGLQWRNIGPFHGGRIASVAGVIGQPGVFYAGMPAGGIWKTTSAGVTWYPIFDSVKEVDSIGAIQVAPSDPNVIYAGSGDSVQGSNGDGMYKSTDAGKTWTHIGLADTTKINKILIDPKDPNLVLASTTGDAEHTGGGVYRTTDGGQTWKDVLKPEGVGGTRDLAYAYDMPNLIFAATQGYSSPEYLRAQQAAGRGGGGGFGGGGGRGGGVPEQYPPAIYKSADEGLTWAKITTLPKYSGRIGVAVAMHTNGQRLYVIGGNLEGGSGLYRSDDQGATWQHMAGNDTRISNGQGTYSCGVWVDSQNPDILYTVSTASYQSTDGGKTFKAFKGAPGGEDYHDIWIDPTNGERMLFGVDQGASVTLDGGKTWSAFYNQSISQIYHVATDTRYPFWVMGSQQDTGAVMTRAFSDQGQVTTVDWYPLPSSEFGTVSPDPLNPMIIYGVGYGTGQGAGMIKIDLATGQWGNVNPAFGADAAKYPSARDQFRRFDTAFDPKAFYVAYNCLLVSHDGAITWKAFSPDLTAAKGEPLVPCGTPAAGGRGRGARAGRGAAAATTTAAARGAAGATTAAATPTPPPAPAGRGGGAASINDFEISTLKPGVVWTGSSNGQVYNTFDGGKTWTNVTNFPDLPENGSIAVIEAGHTDINTAYVLATVGGGRGGGGGGAAAQQHYIYRTHDAGKTWTRIVNGLPTGEVTGSTVSVIREDPKQKGLLFAGTETTAYVSFNDGDNWQSLRLNLPTTWVRDMVFHTDDHMSDLVIATYGRGFWVLDDMTPLRELAQKAQAIGSAPAYLYKPGDAIRARANSNWDQPMEPEQPHAANPPFGALIYYNLSAKPAGPITLEVLDAAGNHVRTISSVPPPEFQRPGYPEYWMMPASERSLSTDVGMNRTHWDLRYDDPPGGNADIENQMNVAPGQVTPGPHGPMALPGVYTLKLTVDGTTYTQSLLVRNDPRVGESAKVMADLRAQDKITMGAYNGMKEAFAGAKEVNDVREEVTALTHGTLPTDVAAAATALDAKLASIGGATGGRGGRGGGGGGGRGGGGPVDPNAVVAFSALNTSFNSVVGLDQNGMDMYPNQALIDTYAADCKNYDRTVAAWKTVQAQDLPAFNAMLTKNNAGQALQIKPTNLTTPATCNPVPPPTPPGAAAAAPRK